MVSSTNFRLCLVSGYIECFCRTVYYSLKNDNCFWLGDGTQVCCVTGASEREESQWEAVSVISVIADNKSWSRRGQRGLLPLYTTPRQLQTGEVETPATVASVSDVIGLVLSIQEGLILQVYNTTIPMSTLKLYNDCTVRLYCSEKLPNTEVEDFSCIYTQPFICDFVAFPGALILMVHTWV